LTPASAAVDRERHTREVPERRCSFKNYLLLTAAPNTVDGDRLKRSR